LHAAGVLEPSDQVYYGGQHAIHHLIDRLIKGGLIAAGSELFVLNLKECTSSVVTATEVCKCAALHFSTVTQMSVKGVQDAMAVNISGVLRTFANVEIQAALHRGAIVYVHCRSGKHRAPAAIISYLLGLKTDVTLPFQDILRLVRISRPCAFSSKTETNTFLEQLESSFLPDRAAVKRRCTRAATAVGSSRPTVDLPEFQGDVVVVTGWTRAALAGDICGREGT
jgi:hypothetical protein